VDKDAPEDNGDAVVFDEPELIVPRVLVLEAVVSAGTVSTPSEVNETMVASVA
jgi:hypothetical protein